MSLANSSLWLALMIGNSRLHWAYFTGDTLIYAWDTDYLPADVIQRLSQSQTLKDLLLEIFPNDEATGKARHGNIEDSLKTLCSSVSSPPPIILASVVPSQTALWQSYPNVRILTLDQVPIKGIYPTLGIDRALALLGAGQNWGFPILVIDAGTALTFTGADANQHLVGGAILPGLGLQLATLAGKTGQLPTVELPQQLPYRYALNTKEAIQSGVIYTLVAGIKDFIEAWWRDFPQGNVVMTGGDRTLLVNYMRSPMKAPKGASQFPEIVDSLNVEANLIFWGMQKTLKNYE
ncbi:pantothenate kinase [Brasilonema octagenarum]|uniref:pantothenate kinase n=1 Tax=Brasilonema octagenarum TaxID=417105 RepID=UPI001B7CEE4B|nr:pantothenate kinase [Brasilonema octagenarum]